jgi:hypothetical protein
VEFSENRHWFTEGWPTNHAIPGEDRSKKEVAEAVAAIMLSHPKALNEKKRNKIKNICLELHSLVYPHCLPSVPVIFSLMGNKLHR